MGVVSVKNLGGSFQHRFGESPSAQIRAAIVLDGQATPVQTILNAGGYAHGTPHPEYSYLQCIDGQVQHQNAFLAEATYSFGIMALPSAGLEPNPLSRADVWSYSTSGISTPTFRYYDNSGLRPLVNTAGDLIEGATTIEGELRATVSGNRSLFPLALAVAYTGAVNSDGFAGAGPSQWLCLGISGQQTTEVVNNQPFTYWQVSAELSYKASGYDLYLPNVGWNYISSSQSGEKAKQRCFVYDGNEKIASSNVMALNDDGSIRFNSDFTGSGAPTLLRRRMNPALPFSSAFGTPQ